MWPAEKFVRCLLADSSFTFSHSPATMGRGEKLSTSDCKLSSVFWSPKTKATDIKSLKFQRKLSQLSCFLRIWFGKMLREEKHLMSWEVERLTTTLRIWIWQNCAQAFYKVFHWFIAIGHICRITFRQKCKQLFSYCHSVHCTQPWCIYKVSSDCHQPPMP